MIGRSHKSLSFTIFRQALLEQRNIQRQMRMKIQIWVSLFNLNSYMTNSAAPGLGLKTS